MDRLSLFLALRMRRIGYRPGRVAPEGKSPRQDRIPSAEWQALLESGEFTSQGDIPTREGITRAIVIRIMGMLRLAPEIQERIRALPDTFVRSNVSERNPRPIGASAGQRDQLREFHNVLLQGPKRW